MKSAQLVEDLVVDPHKPHARALYADRFGRAILWTLEPHQKIQDHRVPDSPFYVVVLKGHGWFAGSETGEKWVGPNTMVLFDPGELHEVRAGDEQLVFVGFLHGAPGNVSDRVGGELGREGS